MTARLYEFPNYRLDPDRSENLRAVDRAIDRQIERLADQEQAGAKIFPFARDGGEQ